MLKRVVIKLSGEALCSEGNAKAGGDKFDEKIIDRLTNEICHIVKQGVQTSLVVGGGNFWRGRDTKEGMNRTKSDQIGMLATLMNAIYLSEALRMKGTNAVVMTPFEAHSFTEKFEIYRAKALLERGTVLIFAGGTGLPFFSTDTITSVRAAELGVDAILFAKNVNGIYDCDPKKFAQAKKYDIITYEEIIAKDLKAIDIAAISICRENGIKSIVFNLDADGAIIKSATGTEIEIFETGTIVKV